VKNPTRARVLLRIGLITTPPKGNTTMNKVSAYWKIIVGAIGTALMIWNDYSPGFVGLLPESWGHNITLVVGILTATGVFTVRNTTTNPAVAATQSVALRTGRHELPE
jgi:hypothetical protein